MRHFRWISIGMVMVGIVVAGLAVAVPLDAFWILGGALLVISGVVKLVILHLWRGLVQPEQAASPIVPRKR